jgi:hypothetical protein
MSEWPEEMGYRVCKQCQRTLPVSQFLWGERRIKNVKVTFCMDCAGDNMAAWAATSLSQMATDKVREKA